MVQTLLGSSPAGCALVTIPHFGHFAQEGSAVQRFAIKTTVACLEELLPSAREAAAKSGGRVLFIGHQANALMLESVVRRSGVEPELHFSNVALFGNTGAAGAPSVLSQNWAEPKAGDQLALVVVGSGLTWAGLRMEVTA